MVFFFLGRFRYVWTFRVSCSSLFLLENQETTSPLRSSSVTRNTHVKGFPNIFVCHDPVTCKEDYKSKWKRDEKKSKENNKDLRIVNPQEGKLFKKSETERTVVPQNTKTIFRHSNEVCVRFDSFFGKFSGGLLPEQKKLHTSFFTLLDELRNTILSTLLYLSPPTRQDVLETIISLRSQGAVVILLLKRPYLLHWFTNI